VGTAGETPRPAAGELDRPGVGEALAELAGDAGERVQLVSGLVAEAEPHTDPIRIALLERVRPLEPRRGDEEHLTHVAVRGRHGLRGGPAPTRDQRQHTRHEGRGVPWTRHGSDSATGPSSGPVPSGLASCPRPA
jgi:hypothetical protein